MPGLTHCQMPRADHSHVDGGSDVFANLSFYSPVGADGLMPLFDGPVGGTHASIT